MKHLGTKRIETPRLVLRRFTMDDVQPMFHNWATGFCKGEEHGTAT